MEEYEEILKRNYPTGIRQIGIEYWDYDQKGIEEKIESIRKKVDEIVEFINEK